jgi:hypothetical protein
MMHGMTHETRALPYPEIARLFNITVPSARNMVRRRRWARMPSNDPKRALVLVPIEALPNCSAPNNSADATRRAASDETSEAPDDTRDGSSNATSGALEILARHVEMLHAELAIARAEAARSVALDVSLAALRATLEAVREERDRLVTREHLREQKWWWRWRKVG